MRAPSRGPTASTLGAAASACAVGLALVPTASAHGGSVHGGTPHWTLFATFLVGLGVVAASALLGRTGRIDRPRLVVVGVLGGLLLATLPAIGLTELQAEPLGTDATPIPRVWYPVLTLVTGTVVLLASVLLGVWRWEGRPAYAALGSLLGLWVLYPLLVPGSGEYWHPLGYLLVGCLPVLVGYVVWRDVRPALRGIDPASRRIGGLVASLFTVFLLFSTGQFTLNPEQGMGVPDESFLVVTRFANPLVTWPAVEFYARSVPLFGALSVGTALTFALLAGLVGINASLTAAVWRRDVPVDGGSGVLGGVATTGATTCCCCAPAFYGVASAALGLSTSPLYWVFLDPASPIGTLFFVGATALLVGSAIRLSAALAGAGVCDLDRARPSR
ncbi:MAG: hypothetical protein ABEJ85_00075 [Haloarculaceae archaeon]